MKAGTTEKLKFLVLKNSLQLPKFQVIGLLEGLWQLTASSAMDGGIGRFSDVEIAAWLEYPGDAATLVAALVKSGFLDDCAEYRLVVHDWKEHAPQFVKGNMAKHGREFLVAVPPAIAACPEQSAIAACNSTVPPSQAKPSQEEKISKPSASHPSEAEGTDSASRCPYAQIVALYHEVLPDHPRVRELTNARRSHMRARWANGMERNLETFRSYFEAVKRSRFLTGRVDPPPGRPVFIADFDFLMRESTYVKILEGKYRD